MLLLARLHPSLALRSQPARLGLSWLVLLLAHPPAFAETNGAPAIAPEVVDVLNRHAHLERDCLLAAAPERLESSLAPDVRLLTEAQKTAVGPAAVIAYLRALTGRFKVEQYEKQPLGRRDLGAQVMEYGHLHLRLASRSSGQIYALDGKYLNLWKKRADGPLALCAMVWNYDQGYDFLAALSFPEVPGIHTALAAHVAVRDPISFELAGLNLLLGNTVAQHDAVVWSQFFADDAVLMMNREPISIGRAAIDRSIADHVKTLPVFEHLDIRNDRIDDLGAYVVEYASHVAAWRSGDSSGVSTGKNLRLWQRQPSGALKLFLQIGAYD